MILLEHRTRELYESWRRDVGLVFGIEPPAWHNLDQATMERWIDRTGHVPNFLTQRWLEDAARDRITN